MILIDSVYINDGGGLVLLKQLVSVLNKTNLKIFYLFDERTKEIFGDFNSLNAQFISNGFFDRMNFYKSNKDKFLSILCFGNIPPPVKVEAKVFVYFHQPLFLNIPEEFSFKNKLIYRVKQFILNRYKNNADIWLTQSSLIQIELANKYFKKDFNNIKVLPFYPQLDFSMQNAIRKKNSFLYVSNTAPHKNHKNLIYAFCDAYDRTQIGELILTVPDSAISLCLLIKEKINKGYPITNVGFIGRNLLIHLYLSAEYLIYPSLAESFGLGLAEAIDGGCKVIASDLPYTYQVCNPSLTFNPYTKESIESAIIEAVRANLPGSRKIISNDINQLIKLLSD